MHFIHAVLQLPSLVMWPHHYGWHLTPTLFWHAHGCCLNCSGVTCGQEKSQAAWASMGAMPCCWPSCKQLCLIRQTFALESSPTDSRKGNENLAFRPEPTLLARQALVPDVNSRVWSELFSKSSSSKRKMQRNPWTITLRNHQNYDEALLQLHWPSQAVIIGDGRWKLGPRKYNVLQGWAQCPCRSTRRAGCLRVKSPLANARVVTAPRIRDQVFWEWKAKQINSGSWSQLQLKFLSHFWKSPWTIISAAGLQQIHGTTPSPPGYSEHSAAVPSPISL